MRNLQFTALMSLYQTEFAALQGQLTALGSGTFNGVGLFTGGGDTVCGTSTVHTNEDSTTNTTITKAALLGDTSIAAAVGPNASVDTVAHAVSATASSPMWMSLRRAPSSPGLTSSSRPALPC